MGMMVYPTVIMGICRIYIINSISPWKPHNRFDTTKAHNECSSREMHWVQGRPPCSKLFRVYGLGFRV